MEKVEETIGIGHNLRKSLDTLKSKVNLSLPSIVQPSNSFTQSQLPLNSQEKTITQANLHTE